MWREMLWMQSPRFIVVGICVCEWQFTARYVWDADMHFGRRVLSNYSSTNRVSNSSSTIVSNVR